MPSEIQKSVIERNLPTQLSVLNENDCRALRLSIQFKEKGKRDPCTKPVLP